MENGNQPFNLDLDRTGQSREEIRASIKSNIDLIEQVLTLTATDYFEERNVTNFIYDLEYSKNVEESIEAIEYGIESLVNHLKYLLSFNKKIGSIKYNENKYEVIERKKSQMLPNAFITTVSKSRSDEKESTLNLEFSKGSIAVPINEDNNHPCFQEIPENIAKLNCNFPLIGSEKYPFPMILNSKNFNVEIDRNGIFELDPVNMVIIEEAISQYKNFLSCFKDTPERDTFNLCKFDHLQNSDYKKKLVSQLDSIIMNEELIRTVTRNLLPIKDIEEEVQICVPNSKAEKFKERVWKLVSIIPNINIPEYQFIDGWRSVVNNDITLKSISEKELKNRTIQELADWLGEIDYIDWLNNYYQLLNDLLDKGFEEYYIPNSARVFSRPNELILTENLMPELIEIWTTINKSRLKRIVLSEIIVPEKFKDIMIKKSNGKNC